MKDPATGPDLSLTPGQEDLLRTALSSNQRGSPKHTGGSTTSAYQQSVMGHTMADTSTLYTSPTENGASNGRIFELDDSPLMDNLDDANFDWDNTDQLFGYISGNDFDEDGELHDKRKASSESNGSSKRQEGDDKTPKKPGRKPLTAEPNTKRKAQNRAAQRAFRERKERHLKDLETKVEDLEKASESTNHENGRLRATVDKLNTELKEYRKRLSLNATAAGHSPPPATQNRSQFIDTSNDFQFAFPKFGDLPGSSFLTNGSLAKTSGSPQANTTTATLGPLRNGSSSSSKAFSPTSQNGIVASPAAEAMIYQASPAAMGDAATKFDGFNGLTGLFSPSVLETVSSRSNSTDYFPNNERRSTSGSIRQSSVSGSNGAQPSKPSRAASASMSPASSMSHGGLDSSVGTTPEPSSDSPAKQPSNESILNPISEESTMQNNNGGFSNTFQSTPSDFNGIDWMAQQNGGQFDPVLFGDYRDPQDNILNNTFDDFFNDALPTQDFASPYNTGDVPQAEPKRDLMKEIEVKQNGGNEDREEDNCVGLTKLWDRMQNSEKVQSGEADMDDLCSQLKAKARCSGKGAEIAERDVDKILGPVSPTKDDHQFKMFN